MVVLPSLADSVSVSHCPDVRTPSARDTPATSAGELHAFAFDTVREATKAGQFTVLTEDRDYRIRQYADPAAFATMLGFYKVKWLYIEAIRQMSAFTDPLTAIRLISAMRHNC